MFHIVFGRETDLAAAARGAACGANPRHSMALLAERLSARVHDGRGLVPTRRERALARLTGMSPIWWAIARDVRRQLTPGDVVFCTGEDVGTPVAGLCGGYQGCRVVIMTHRMDTAKKRAAFRLMRLGRRVSTFLAVSTTQVEATAQLLGRHRDRVRFCWDQTDTEFFSPGPGAEGPRPVIVSVGLERRDYGLLAQATADLGVDVRISGFSADTRVLAQAFPAEMPANFSRTFYSWPDLRQLYRDAAVVVVSLFPNSYAAGVQALMEGLASGRPVVVTTTEGLQHYLDQTDAMTVVPPGDTEAMRAAILGILNDPVAAAARGNAARALACQRHTVERYIDTIEAELRRLASS